MTGLIAFSLWLTSNLLRPVEIKRDKFFLAPPHEMVRFTFGYSEVLADIFWLRAIQDFDYCEKLVAENVCKGNSWLYKMLDIVMDLSPHFRMVHATGPIALSVIISDIEGASKLFDKAVERYPNDWSILGRAAYHALYEEDNQEKAAQRLRQAAVHGGPDWYYVLSGRLYAESGKLELGEALLKEMKESGQPEDMIERLEKRLSDIKKYQKPK